MTAQSRQSLPKLGTPEYKELTQYVEKPPLPFRRTIRRIGLHEIVPLAETTIYDMERGGQFLRRYAAKNMALNLNRTFVLPYTSEESSEKSHVAAYYTLAHQTLIREELPDPSRLPRYPVLVILLAQLGIDRRFHRQGLGAKTLVHALRHAYQIANNPNGIPALGIVLDVLDQEALAFYRSFDFFLPLTDTVQ